jgi:peptidoglycan/xylan/chitin deacetylase (PgdA/CDA1 family)
MQCERELGLNGKIVRLPGRDIWVLPSRTRGLNQSGGGTAKILGQNGYKLYGWDMEWRRKGDNTPLESSETMIKQIDAAFASGSMWTKNHLVILAHDPMFMKAYGQQELRQLIDYIQKRGYVLEHMRHYPNTSKISG